MMAEVVKETVVCVEGYPDIQTPTGLSLLEVCEAADVPMESECGGFAGCNSCRVDVLADASGLSARDPIEVPFLDQDDQRLGCQAIVHGPVKIRLCPGML
jgi:ferredoxin